MKFKPGSKMSIHCYKHNGKIHRTWDEVIILDETNEKLGLNKNFIFSSAPKYKVLSARLKRVVKKSMKYILESLKYSDFEVLGNEVEFKEGKEYSQYRVYPK